MKHRLDGTVTGRGLLGTSRIALLLVVLLGAGLVALHIDSYRQLSQYDEAQHIDYVHHLLRPGVPKSGDRWLPPTTYAVACRNIDSPWPYPPCDSSADNGQMPNYGLTTEFIQTPLYYLGVVGVAVTSAQLLPFSIDEISAMRATNAGWLAVGLVLLWLLWRDLNVPYLVRAGFSIGLIASPTLLLAQSTVSNDGTALAAGAAVLLATLRWAAGRCQMWVPLAVAVVALVLKMTNLAAVLVACAFILVRSLQQAEGTQQRWRNLFAGRNIVFVAVCAVATILVGVGWSIFQERRATLDLLDIPQNMMFVQDRFDLSWLLAALLAVTTPLEPQWLPAAMAGVVGSLAAYITTLGLLGLAIVGAVRSAAGSVVRALSIATALAALTFGPLLTVANYASLHIYFLIPPRYGFSLLPAMVAIAATAVRSRRAQIALLVVALGLYVADAAHLLLAR